MSHALFRLKHTARFARCNVPFFGVFQEYTMTLWESQSLGECFSVEGDFA